MSLRYTTRPLSDRTWLRPEAQRQHSRFESTWTKTLQLLGREIDHLSGRDVVIEVDVRERDIRLDGMLRADAKAASPAVVVAFETPRHGSMLYRCDRYRRGWRSGGTDWQENVRAVALTLESLRAVDRYGATETGQQYTGFKALPAGTALPSSHMTSDEAWSILGSFGDRPIAEMREKPSCLPLLLRRARSFAHPDRHDGDRELWDQVEKAAAVLGVRS